MKACEHRIEKKIAPAFLSIRESEIKKFIHFFLYNNKKIHHHFFPLHYSIAHLHMFKSQLTELYTYRDFKSFR